MVKKPPTNAGNTGSMPSLETKSLHAKGQLSLHVATESLNSSAHAPQQEKPPRWEAHAPQLETSPY